MIFEYFQFRDMIGEGAWMRNMSYITCDDYDGKNSPQRTGLNLQKYFSKVNAFIINEYKKHKYSIYIL